MKINWTFAINIATTILKPLIPIITNTFREQVEKQVIEWAKRAEETENPWDDVFFDTLKKILGID